MPLRNVAGMSIKRELYSRPPNWWSRFTWPITAGILIWTAVGAETFMNRWTRVVPKSKDENGSPTSNDAKPQYELRPWNHRALASFLLFISGTTLAVFFIQGRSYIIKQVDGVFVPISGGASAANNINSSKQLELRYLVFKSFGAVGSRHSLVPKEQCEIVPTKGKNEMKLRVNNESTYWLGLDRAKISGEGVKEGPEVAYARLVQALGLNSVKGRWKGGPIAKNK